MYGDEYLKRNLTDPPRHIPTAVLIQMLLGGFISLFGWIFFGFGMIFFWAFVLNCDPVAWWDFRGQLDSAPGVVTSVDETRFSEGGSEHSSGTPIYAYQYQFTHANQTFDGISYRLGARAELNSNVSIEFPQGRPQRSRIKGYRTKPFTSLVLFVVLFPAIGLIIILARLRTGWKRRYLLKYGELAEGKLISKDRTNTEINDQPVYKLTFEFKTSLGSTAQLTVKTHNVRPLEDDEFETLLYDPTKPSRGTTLDHLPGQPQINEDGTIGVQNARAAYLALIVPAVSIIGHGTYLLLRYIW